MDNLKVFVLNVSQRLRAGARTNETANVGETSNVNTAGVSSQRSGASSGGTSALESPSGRVGFVPVKPYGYNVMIGDNVVIYHKPYHIRGVIRWIGQIPLIGSQIVAVVEMEQYSFSGVTLQNWKELPAYSQCSLNAVLEPGWNASKCVLCPLDICAQRYSSTTNETFVKDQRVHTKEPGKSKKSRYGQILWEGEDNLFRIKVVLLQMDQTWPDAQSEFRGFCTTGKQLLLTNVERCYPVDQPLEPEEGEPIDIPGRRAFINISHLEFVEPGATVIQKGDTALYKNQAFGLVREIFKFIGDTEEWMALMELDEPHPKCNNGTYKGYEFMKSPFKNILFGSLDDCVFDPRGQLIDELTVCMIPHLKVYDDQTPCTDLTTICGLWKGIQGSTDLTSSVDTVLYCMFAFCTAFDGLLKQTDLPDKKAIVQRLLRTSIVNPLRKYGQVAAFSVLTLKHRLVAANETENHNFWDRPGSMIEGLLLILNSEPLAKLSRGINLNVFEITPDPNSDFYGFPTLQVLLQQYCFTNRVNFTEVPQCIIISTEYCLQPSGPYPKIFPNSTLDISPMLECNFRKCDICRENTCTLECAECTTEQNKQKTAVFCATCSKRCHSKSTKVNHRPTIIASQSERCILELSAIVFETGTQYYDCLCKTAPGLDAEWVDFIDARSLVEYVAVPEVSKPKSVFEMKDLLTTRFYLNLLENPSEENVMGGKLFKQVSLCIYTRSESTQAQNIQ